MTDKMVPMEGSKLTVGEPDIVATISTGLLGLMYSGILAYCGTCGCHKS